MKSKHLAASLLALACLPALAQQADLKVIGGIVPQSCIPTFTGGDTLDFGDFSASTLSATAFTYIGTMDTQLTLTCASAPARMAIRAPLDNRAASRVTGMAEFLAPKLGTTGAWGNNFGLGLVDGKSVGSYLIQFPAGATGDGASIDHIMSVDAGANWVAPASGLMTTNANRRESWADTGTLTPKAYTTVVQPIRVAVGINKTGDLPPLTARVPLDGLATFYVVYP